jgi:uncharacterized protein YkwD
MSSIFKINIMKNLILILSLFVFSFSFCQSQKKDAGDQLVAMVREQNSLAIKSFDCDSSSLETIKLVNKYRKSKGLTNLSIDTSLMSYAKQYSKYLSTNNKLLHSSIEQTSIKAENLYNKSSFGMYILTYEELSKVPIECVDGWKESEGHNKNMLIYNVTTIGIGTYISNTNGFRLNIVMVVK